MTDLYQLDRWGSRFLACDVLATALCSALGGSNLKVESGKYNSNTFEVNGVTVYVNAEHGAKDDRAGVSANAPDLTCQLAGGYVPPEPFPRITVDPTRDLTKLAADIRKRVIEPSAAPLAALKAKLEKQNADAASVKAFAADLQARIPALRIILKDSGTSADLYGSALGTYLSGRISAGGGVSLDRVGVTYGDHATRILTAILSAPST